MQTHAKKNSFAVLALLLTLQATHAQNAPGGEGGAPPAPPSAPKAAATTGSPTEVDTTANTAFDYIFNHKAQNGTIAKSGSDVASAIADRIKAADSLKTPGLDDPEMKARFITYLSLKEVPDARIKEYFGKMAQVSDVLKQGDTFGAWKLLYALGDYQDIDAGISRELANRVESMWNSDRTRNGLAQTNTQLQSDIEGHTHNADMIAEDLHHQALEEQMKNSSNNAKGGGGGNNNNNSVSNQNTTNSPLLSPNADPAAAEAAIMPTMSAGLERKMELTDEYLKLLEDRAKIRLNEIQANKMSDQDRVDFRDYIKTLYDGHRYYHVLIAADFYRAIFNTGDYPADLANQVVAATGSNARSAADSANQVGRAMGFNNRGFRNAMGQAGNMMGVDHSGQNSNTNQPLTLADEVTAALEINNRVSNAIEVFKYKTDKGEIAAASEQLQEAFVGNEFHPALQGLARTDKEKVGDFLTKLDVLKNELEVRDFEQVEAQVSDIKKVANDFDSTKATAMVNDIKLASRLCLGKAKMEAQGGQLSDALADFQTAAEFWPGNPDLQTSANGFFSTEDVANKSTTEFDRLVQDQNYRGIADKAVAFAPAIKDDTGRQQQLKDALTKVQKAEMASEKANMLVMNGDVNGAWETIELAAKDWPEDMKLNKLLASLSQRSADFVSALNKAQDAETKNDLGYSLTWYVNAQSQYPPSKLANDGIKRVSDLILAPASVSSSPQAN